MVKMYIGNENESLRLYLVQIANGDIILRAENSSKSGPVLALCAETGRLVRYPIPKEFGFDTDENNLILPTLPF